MNQPPKFQPEKNKKFAARPDPQPVEPTGNVVWMLCIVFAILLVIALFLLMAK